MKRFSAQIHIIGVNPYVFLPEEVLQFLFDTAKKDKGPIPVKGKINGKDFKQTLVKYAGLWRLYINGIMIQATGLKVGHKADIDIMFDPVPRIEPMHAMLEKAFEKYPKAKKEFDQLPPSRQKEINRYLNTIKSDEIREKNIQKVIKHLLSDPSAEYFVIMSYYKKKK